MAITSIDNIAAGLSLKKAALVVKAFTAPKAAGAFQSGWKAAGNPVAGANPPLHTAGSGYTCSSGTTGAISVTNAAVQNWIAKMTVGMTQIGTLILADRLWSCLINGFAAATYTITTPGSLPGRITDNGLGVEAWLEQFVAAGAASGTATLSFTTPESGSSTAVVSAVVSAPVIGQMQPLLPTTPVTGIKAPVSLALSATWTSGTTGLTLLKRLAEIPLPTANVAQVMDWAAIGLPAVPNDACLMLFFMAAGTTAPTLVGSIDVVDL